MDREQRHTAQNYATIVKKRPAQLLRQALTAERCAGPGRINEARVAVVELFEGAHVSLKKQTHQRSVGRRFAIIHWM